MEPERHEMVVVSRQGVESVFECTSQICGRQLVLNHDDGRMTVVNEGDREVLHYGSSGLVSMSAEVTVTTAD